MKRITPFAAALLMLAAIIAGSFLIKGNEVGSDTSFEGAEWVYTDKKTEDDGAFADRISEKILFI